MGFGQIIKQLRRREDMTQEQLAEALSISGQAVSRWENDLAMPDITFIPVLCGLFGVTADELLGIDNEKRQEEIDTILKKTAVLDPLEKLPIPEDALRRYPDSFDLMSELMYVYYGEERSDDATRHCAVQVLCLTYAEIGRTEEADRPARNPLRKR